MRMRPDLSAPEKAAVLLLTMDKAISARLLAHFSEAEVDALAQTAARLGSLPRHRLEGLIDEFASAVADGSDISGGAASTAQLLDGVMPPERLTLLMDELNGGPDPRVWERLNAANAATVAALLRKQHPQAAAYILSRITGGTVSEALDLLPEPLRLELLRRLLTLRDLTADADRLIELALAEALTSPSGSEGGSTVHARLAALLNRMERPAAEAALASIAQARPKDADKIKALLFNFEDIVKLSPGARAKLFEAVQVEATILALRGADPELREMVLASQSQRARRMIEAELQSGATPPKADIARAQRSIADQALELAESGAISLTLEAAA